MSFGGRFGSFRPFLLKTVLDVLQFQGSTVAESGSSKFLRPTCYRSLVKRSAAIEPCELNIRQRRSLNVVQKCDVMYCLR